MATNENDNVHVSAMRLPANRETRTPAGEAKDGDASVRKMPDEASNTEPAKERPVHGMQQEVAGEASGTQQRAKIRTGDDAIRVILEPTRRKEGFRHCVFGSPGKGKTHHARAVVAACLEKRSVDFAFSHDTKGAVAEFTGEERANVADLRARPPKATHVVFRGDAWKGIECSPEEPAALALHLARTSRARGLVTLNELDQALTPGGRGWAAPSVRLVSSQGRALQLSLLCTTQQPHRTPAEILDQATSIAFFRLEARSLNYLSNVLLLPPELVEAVGNLPARRFVLYVPGVEFDGTTYEH